MRDLAKAVDLHITAAEGNIHLIVHFVDILFIYFIFYSIFVWYIYRYIRKDICSVPLERLLICDIQHPRRV